MRIAVIINPVAGRGRRRAEGGARRDEAATIVAEASLDATVELTSHAGHGAELARAAIAAGAEAIVVWGGDGTVNEVAGAIIGRRTALGIVPCGSGDGLARGLGLPVAPRAILAAAARRSAAPIDVGFLGDRHFLNIAGIGFDAVVAAAFSRRGRFGALSYTASALSGVWTYRPTPFRVTLERAPADGRWFVVSFANGRQYGNGLVIAPMADPADGRLDVVVVDDGSPFAQMWRARRLFIGPDRPARGVLRARVAHASVEGPRLVCHVDGEPFEASGLLPVRVDPGAIRIVGFGDAVAS